ncbi:ABC transporter ATP-binding protein [Variovorax ginsengisoli]|uniref:ABC-type multidrug transport system ATPase subunit n=1 Tax=Variovorax ginsengisoli TaxID=363844 RepID=A0ABT9S4H1_9BURK|nr:ATP-binding cassette domain-containing protein [Variovorax ginsengisoli]MDP9898247.1 ABC-type multidrug transport system ATPase subunit [Variovorax ginsengisoli]
MTALPPLLDIHRLRVGYPHQTPIVDGWSTRIAAGVTWVHGDTGAGKSTLLRVLAGMQPADAGRLTVAGVDLARDPAAYRRHVFFGDHTDAALDPVTGRACTARLREDDPAFDEAFWQELVEGFALAPQIDKPMYMLSTGSRRKVWLASALASGRALVLIDEPTGGLDAASRRCLWRALTHWAAKPSQAVIVGSGETLEGVPLAATVTLPLRG